MVYRGALKSVHRVMAKKYRKAKKGSAAVMPRASVSFPPELYKTLEELAKRKKVSIAWVVREAAEQYVSMEWPLFASSVPLEVK
jgi:predicted DNA-binding protein